MPHRQLVTNLRTKAADTAVTVDVMAGTVARILKRHVEENGEITDPQAWIKAAHYLGVKVYRYRDKGKAASGGYYVSDAKHGGAIFYNSCAPPYTVCRRICHELAHALLVEWTGSGLRRTRPEQYDDDRDTLQHQVARRVEEILLP